jgi:hypothetical protein
VLKPEERKMAYEENDAFNGSTATFASGALGNGILDINSDDTTDPVDVSGSVDEAKKWVKGQTDGKISITVVGDAGDINGTHGALAIDWNDGTTTGSEADALCTGVSKTGSKGDVIKSTCTFVPYGGT